MSTNHEAVAALPVLGAADKALVRAMAARRFVYCLDTSESVTNFVAVDPNAGTLPLYLLQNSVLFQFDPLDTTTPNDGITCLVTSDGKRYKVGDKTAFIGLLAFSDISGQIAPGQIPNPSAATLGGVKSLAAVSHKWISQIGADGQPLATQPAAGDLSNGTTGSNAVVLNTAPTIASPIINSGAITDLTALSLRSVSAFDLTLAATESLSAAHTLSFVVNNADRAVNLGGGLTLAGALTTFGAFSSTFTMTGATAVTFPTAGTLATIAGVEALTNKTVNGNTFTSGTYTLTGGAGKTFTFSNSLTVEGPDRKTINIPSTVTLFRGTYHAHI